MHHNRELLNGARMCRELSIARHAYCVLADGAEKALRRALDLKIGEAKVAQFKLLLADVLRLVSLDRRLIMTAIKFVTLTDLSQLHFSLLLLVLYFGVFAQLCYK